MHFMQISPPLVGNLSSQQSNVEKELFCPLLLDIARQLDGLFSRSSGRLCSLVSEARELLLALAGTNRSRYIERVSMCAACTTLIQ
jgi:hypothetical protein